MATKDQPRIAVVLPCYNEEAAIAATVAGFKTALPGAVIYVYDNNSRDRTRVVAAEAGAVVRTEIQQVGSSRVDLQACKLEYSIVSPK